MRELLKLAARCEAFSQRAKSILDNEAGLSVSGQSIAISMLVTMNLPMFDEVPAALRAISASKS